MKLRNSTNRNNDGTSKAASDMAVIPTHNYKKTKPSPIHVASPSETRDVRFTSNSILAPSTSTEQSSPPATTASSSSISRHMFCGIRPHDCGGRELAPPPDQCKIMYRQFGNRPSDVLQVVYGDGIPTPPGLQHVVIKVEASTISLDDCIVRRGFDFDFLNPIALPQTPGMDVVGHIIELPRCCRTRSATRWSVGDRVAALVRTGGNARYCCAHVDALVSVPTQGMDAAEAVAMVSNYTTAYQVLKRIRQEGSVFSMLGRRVLIVGGMDGPGQALIQMCTKARATVHATGPVHRHTYIHNILGAKALPETGWLTPAVQGSMDYVFDGVCENGLEMSHKALKEKTGELVCFGHTAMLREREMGFLGAPASAYISKIRSQLYLHADLDIWQSYNNDPDTYKKNLKSLLHLLKWDKLKPHIAKRVGLEGVAAAQTKLESGELRGTVVCLPWKGKAAPA